MILVYTFLRNLIETNKRYLALFYFFIGAFFATANILVLNEESLVAICFVVFVVTLYVYGRAVITDALTERTRSISVEFDSLFDLQLKNKDLLISCYQQHFSLITKVHSVLSFSKSEIKQVVSQREKMLNVLISNQIEQKLASILSKEIVILMSIQSEIVKLFTAEIRKLFTEKSNEQQRLKNVVTEESISKLETIK